MGWIEIPHAGKFEFFGVQKLCFCSSENRIFALQTASLNTLWGISKRTIDILPTVNGWGFSPQTSGDSAINKTCHQRDGLTDSPTPLTRGEEKGRSQPPNPPYQGDSSSQASTAVNYGDHFRI
jgi:hypothetical protein